MPAQDVQRWRDAVASGKLPNGNALTPAQKIALQKRIEEYEATAPTNPETVAAATAPPSGEGLRASELQQPTQPAPLLPDTQQPGFLGWTPGTESTAPEPQTPEVVTLNPRELSGQEQTVTTDQARLAELGMSRHPEELAIPPGSVLEQTVPGANDEFEWNQATQKHEPVKKDEFRDESLRNLSKDTRLDTPIYNPPSSAAGYMTTVWHVEPTPEYVMEAFKHSPELRERANATSITEQTNLKENDQAYKVAADLIWQDALRRAKEQGRGIIRGSQAGDGVASRLGAAIMNDFVVPAHQFAANMVDSATLGWGLRGSGKLAELMGAPEGFSEEMQDTADMAPRGTRLLGGIAGAMMPGSGPSRLFNAASAKMGTQSLAQIPGGPGLIGGLMKAGAAGGLTGGVEATSQEMAEQFLGSREKAMSESLRNVINSTLVGFGLGFGGELLGRGAAAHVQSKRAADPSLRKFEDAGGDYRLTGVKYAKDLQDYVDSYAAKTRGDVGAAEPLPGYVDRVFEPMARQAKAGREGVVQKAHDRIGAFHASKEGQVKRDTQKIWEWLRARIAEARGGSIHGQPMGGQKPGYLEEEFRNFSMGKRITNPGQVGPKYEVMKLDEARKLMGNEWLDGIKPTRTKTIKGEKHVVDWDPDEFIAIRARPHDARAIDNAAKAFHSRIADSKLAGVSDQEKAWAELDAIVRQQRDKSKAWKEAHRKSQVEFREMNDTLYDSGFTRFRGDLDKYLEEGMPGHSVVDPKDMARARQTLSSYGDPESTEAANRALEYLASKAGRARELLNIAQLREGQKLKAKAAGAKPHVGATAHGGFVSTGGGMARWAADRLYGPAKVAGSTPPARSIDFDALKSIDLNKLPRSVFDWLKSQRGQRVNIDEVVRNAFGLRGGAPARIAGAEDMANLQTLIDVAFILEGVKTDEPARNVSDK